MKKNNIFKFLSLLILAIYLSFSSVVMAQPRETKQQTKEIEQNIKENEELQRSQIKENLKMFKNFKKEDYILKDFNLTVYYKSGIPILHYVHKKTKANIVVVAVKNKEQLEELEDLLLFKAKRNDDRGFVHYCEHILAGGDYGELMKKYDGLYKINASTTDEGLSFTTSANFPHYKEYLKAVAKNLISADSLFKKEIFEREKKRIFYELRDVETGDSGDLARNYNFDKHVSNRQYNVAGTPEEAKKIGRQEVIEFYKEKIHPSNMLAVKHLILNVKNVKEYLKNLNELYLKHYEYKNCKTTKTKLKDARPYKKINWPYDAKLFKIKEEGKNFKLYDNVARAVYYAQDLNVELKKLFCFMIKCDEGTKKIKFVEELNKYVKTLGYDYVKIKGLNDEDSKFTISLYSNNKEKFKEKTLRENLNKILKFIKEKLKDMNNLELTAVLSPAASSFAEHAITVKGKFDLDAFRYFNFGLIGFLVQKSFAFHNEAFSNKIFNIDENNNLIESRESVIESVKNNLYLYDLLIKNGPKYIDYFVADKKIRYADKFELDFLPYNIPIKIKNYNNNKALFYLTSVFMSRYFSDCLGAGNSLTHSSFGPAKYYGGPVSNSQACSESRDAVFKYINKNFDNIIKNFKLTRKEFDHVKQENKNMFVKFLSECRLGVKQFESFKKDIEMFLEGKENKKPLITNKLKVIDFIELYLRRVENGFFVNPGLYDSLKDYINRKNKNSKLKREFYKKYSDEQKINKNIVRDYFSSHVEPDYLKLKKSLKFYEQIVREVDSVKYEDVLEVIKSSYLVKDKELEEVKKVNKILGEIDKKTRREKFEK